MPGDHGPGRVNLTVGMAGSGVGLVNVGVVYAVKFLTLGKYDIDSPAGPPGPFSLVLWGEVGVGARGSVPDIVLKSIIKAVLGGA